MNSPIEIVGTERLKQNLENRIWTTVEGEEIPIKDMHDLRLVDMIKFLRRGGEWYAFSSEWLEILEKESEKRDAAYWAMSCL